MKTKLSIIVDAARIGDWRTALKVAAKFPQLGDHKARITTAWAALNNAQFYREIQKDPEALVKDGIAALKERYDLE